MKIWQFLPAKLAHDLAPYALPVIARAWGVKETPQRHAFKWEKLKANKIFANPLGIAGGVDKTGEQLLSWQQLGAGFLELGTLTPLPQKPNPGQILARSFKHLALWNKMGFPNAGVADAKRRLEALDKKLRVPLFINIGKNRQTPNEEAHKDYQTCIRELKTHADVFVINISSPNTKGLRDLQASRQLGELVKTCQDETGGATPLLVKLSPDLTEDSLKSNLEVLLKNQIDGITLTNTSIQRPPGTEEFLAHEGGVSGAPLKILSRSALSQAIEFLGEDKKKLLIVSAGGIDSKEELLWRLHQGANLCQVYAALVFKGPRFFQNVWL